MNVFEKRMPTRRNDIVGIFVKILLRFLKYYKNSKKRCTFVPQKRKNIKIQI